MNPDAATVPATGRSDWLDRYLLGVWSLALLVTAVVAWVDAHYWTDPVHWAAFAMFAVLLVVGELESITWLRLHGGGEVTPGWAFAFSLILLGSPIGAIAAMTVASVIPDLYHRKDVRRILFNVGQMAIALGAASLVLTVSGFHEPLVGDSDFTVGWGLAILGAGAAIFVLNVVLTCTAIALSQGVSVRSLLRRAFDLSMSVDGALLALSPIFVIAVDYSLLMVPLLVVTSALVYLSAREALEREHHATHDHLTQLLNARAFAEHVDAALTVRSPDSPPACVLLLDLDGFKEVNDRLGHAVGDRVLERIADRLRTGEHEGLVAARLGGDEFALFLPAVAGRDEVFARGQRLAGTLGRSLQIDGFPVSIGASIGAALTTGDDAETAATLLQSADLAMYRAKRLRTTVELVEDDRTTRASGRISLLADLVRALEDGELSMAYQPQIRLRDGRIEGVEALLRWHHPELGMVPPGDFIGLAEQTDLIGPLTERVLSLVAAEAYRLLEVAPHLRIGINASARNLHDRQFADTVAHVLRRVDLPPHVLEVEMTESAFSLEPERTVLALAALRELGVKVAIDDFGSGYSSFARLHQLPIDRLKIDQSFIRAMATDPQSFLIVRSILDLAQALGLESVAEGVESMEMLHQLRELGCDLVQGYAVARPMRLADAVTWLRDRPVGVPFRVTARPGVGWPTQASDPSPGPVS